jgi:hypothetical protein
MSPTAKIIPDRMLIILIGLLAIMALMRLYTWDQPLMNDLATNAMIANEILEGKILYSEIWSDRAPLIFWTYALAQLIVGYGLQEIYFLWLVTNAFTLMGVYVCASAGNRGSTYGLWAAAFYALISCDPMMEANQPNAEVFMNACMIWALAVLLRDDGAGNGVRSGIMIGLLFGAASFYKSHAIFMAIGLALAHICLPPGGNEKRTRAIRQVACGLGVGVGLWGTLFAYLKLSGTFDDFWDGVYVFMQYYVGNSGNNLLTGLSAKFLFSKHLGNVAPLAIFCLIGLLVCRRQIFQREGFLLVTYGIIVWIMVTLPGQFFAHYYQFWLPFLAVLSAWTLANLKIQLGEKYYRSINRAGIIILVLLLTQARFYFKSPDEWTELIHGKRFVASKHTAELIRPLLHPGETIYNWGFETGFYFYTQSRLPTGSGWWMISLNKGPIKNKLAQRMRQEFSMKPPELFVVSPYRDGWPIPDWLMSKFQPFRDNKPFSPFKIYYLRGGAVESRIMALVQGNTGQ